MPHASLVIRSRRALQKVWFQSSFCRLRSRQDPTRPAATAAAQRPLSTNSSSRSQMTTMTSSESSLCCDSTSGTFHFDIHMLLSRCCMWYGRPWVSHHFDIACCAGLTMLPPQLMTTCTRSTTTRMPPQTRQMTTMRMSRQTMMTLRTRRTSGLLDGALAAMQSQVSLSQFCLILPFMLE